MLRIVKERSALVVALGFLALVLSACGGAQARKAKHLEKGQTFLDQGNYEKARVEFQNALQIAPLDPEALFENGVVAERLGKSRDAAKLYGATIDVNPDHLGARTKLARLYLLAGLSDKALELIGPAIEKHPENSELLTLRGAAHVQKKEIAEGLSDAERDVQLDPNNEDAVSALAGIYVSNKTPDKARILLEESIKRISSNADLRLVLAQIYASEDRPADAERMLIEIVGLRPKERADRIRLAQFYAQRKEPDAAEKVMRDGIKALPEDRYVKLALIDFLSANRSPELAEKELLGMIAARPQDSELKFALANFYVNNRTSAQAEKIYREVIDAEGLNAAGITARDRLAGLLAQRNDIKGTQELLGQVLGKSPRDTDALMIRANIELINKDPKSAIGDLRTVLRDQPNSLIVLRTLARAHMANDEAAIAEETLRHGLETNPKNPALRLDLAQLLAQMNKPDQAKAILVELVKDQPKDSQVLDTLFRVSSTMKDYDTAKLAAQDLVAAQPKGPIGYMYEGKLAEQAGRSDEALRLYGQALQLQPDAFEPLQAQIRILVAAKRLPEAIKRLDDVAAKDAKNAFAPNMKGEILLSQKEMDGAQSAFKVAISRAPSWFVPYLGLAAVQIDTNDADAGLATLRGAESTVSQPEQVSLEIALYYEKAGKAAQAIQEYDAIVRRNPQSDIAANNLAMLLVTYEKDAVSLDRAKALSARFAQSVNASYLDTYGWVLYKHGDAAASVPVLERVASQSPDAPVVLYHLGMAQSQAGLSAQAVDNLTRAVNSGARFSGLDDAKATLDRLAKSPATANSKT